MKKQLIVALGLAVLATPAFATKARLEALGEDNFGSYYIQDNRNIFLNSATLNNHKDFITFELGAALTNATNAATQDVAASPRAEGGFAKSHGNFVYGVHFGNTTPTTALFRSKVTGGQEKNPIDVFIAGDAGVKWGVSVGYESYDGSSGTGDNRISSNALRTRLGVIAGDMEALAVISLKGDVHNRVDETRMEGKSSYLLGVGYLLNNYKLFAEWTNAEAEFGTGNTNEDIEFNRIRLGVGRAERINDRATLFAKVMVEQRTLDDSSNAAAGGASVDTDTTTLPLTVGLEYDAASWLQLRASVIHNVWGTEERDFGTPVSQKLDSSVANTQVRAGASLKFGEFAVDGLISTTNSGDATVASTDTTGGNGNLRTDSLMTRVSFIYNF